MYTSVVCTSLASYQERMFPIITLAPLGTSEPGELSNGTFFLRLEKESCFGGSWLYDLGIRASASKFCGRKTKRMEEVKEHTVPVLEYILINEKGG